MSEEQSKKQALQDIANLIRQAEAAVVAAQVIADKHEVSFYLNLGGYGMGGSYNPEPSVKKDWESSDSDDYGWNSSSESC